MSVILTLTTTTTGGAMTSTTSGIAQADILTGAVIVSIALLASLLATELLSFHEGWNKSAAAAVLGIDVTLLIIFCALVAVNLARL